ncbi:hypothetical protein Tcan_17253 [Toxocara canis]|uniref:Uncharacterized protein n=1 Tax=Toxocara canis TaxID=6265 RepID=A0A0B2VRF3_TOXCA|nr:hypothetical protein Tcan_17253 [Toxocara canis]
MLETSFIQRTIVDAMLIDSSIMLSSHNFSTCAFHNDKLHCFRMESTKEIEHEFTLDTSDSEYPVYRQLSKSRVLPGFHVRNFEPVMGSISGDPPRLLLFDRLTPMWIYEMFIPKRSMLRTSRKQQMRYVKNVKHNIVQISSMGDESLVVTDCDQQHCRYTYTTFDVMSGATSVCAFQSKHQYVSGIFRLKTVDLVEAQSSKLISERRQINKNDRLESEQQLIVDHTMLIIYAITCASILLCTIAIDLTTTLLNGERLERIEALSALFYASIFEDLGSLGDCLFGKRKQETEKSKRDGNYRLL